MNYQPGLGFCVRFLCFQMLSGTSHGYIRTVSDIVFYITGLVKYFRTFGILVVLTMSLQKKYIYHLVSILIASIFQLLWKQGTLKIQINVF